MSTVTLDKPLTLTNESPLLLQSEPRLIDLMQAHYQARLDRRDIQYLNAPITDSRNGLTFRGVSIE